MSDDNGMELEQYKAKLRRQEQEWEAKARRQEQNWQARHDTMLHSDQSAVEIGLVALKTAILVNAGSVVALLAFVGQLWTSDKATMATVLQSTKWFVWGLIAGGAGAGVAYIYQCVGTWQKIRELQEVSEDAEDLKPQKWAPRAIISTAAGMIALVVASFGLFIWGALDIVDTLNP